MGEEDPSQQRVGEDQLSLVGVAAGEPLGDGIYRCTAFVEKPDSATAARELRTPGLPEGEYLAHCGSFVFAPEIFACLSELASSTKPGAELELADAQSLLLGRTGGDYLLCESPVRVYDVGTPEGYAEAFQAFLI